MEEETPKPREYMQTVYIAKRWELKPTILEVRGKNANLQANVPSVHDYLVFILKKKSLSL